MKGLVILRNLSALVLAGILLLGFGLTAAAEEAALETTGEVQPPTETSAPIQPPETTAATLPPETTATPETTVQTQPPQTTAPEETSAETQLPETTTSVTETESTGPAITVPEETTQPEETVPERWRMPRTTITIAAAKETPAGSENVTVQGTVVYASGNRAILQDSTGSLWLTFQADLQVPVVGKVVLVTGTCSGGLAVTTCENLGSGELPAMQTTLEAAEKALRIRVDNAQVTIKWGNLQLTQGSKTYFLQGTLPNGVAEGSLVTAYGIILDSTFYADTLLPSEETLETGDWNLYFGQLHAHCDISGALGTVEEAFQHAAQTEQMDFFAVTDLSHSLEGAASGAIGTDGSFSEDWRSGKEAAAKATTEAFVGIYGYEMAWPEELDLGHINTFGTPGWQTWKQPGLDTLERYYQALATVPGAVSQFNHPGTQYGEFQKFRNYRPEYDAVMQLLEVGSEDGYRAYEYYTMALDNGWHVAPTNNQDNHEGNWGSESDTRTVVLTKSLTEASLYEAMANRRVYATEDRDLSIVYQLNGQVMGSILGPQEDITITVSLQDPTAEAIGKVEVVVENDQVLTASHVETSTAELTLPVAGGHEYYYLRILRNDSIVAVTAPVWVDSFENAGIRSFTAEPEMPEQGELVQLRLELYNDEDSDFSVDTLKIFHGETLVEEITDLGTVEAHKDLTCSVPFLWEDPGEVQLQAVVTGTMAGADIDDDAFLTLRFQAKEETVSTIAAVRQGQVGSAYRITGYVTAGNANPYNTFPNTLYLQDDTGGIAITGYAADHIQVGTYMEVSGVLRNQGGNWVLELTDCAFPEKEMYRYVPRTMTHDVAMDYAAHGGELLQIEGEVVSLVKTGDGKGISRMTLKDIRGDLATVLIEEYIGSGAYGTNELAAEIREGRTARAMGLLHVDEYGMVVLRVRNCEEVVYVPPVADASNPKTGDRK